MNILEKELEDLIFNGEKQHIYDRGLFSIGNYSVFSRQLRIGGYGIADIVGFNYDIESHSENLRILNIGIFEIKKEKITIEAFKQAIRYAKGLEVFIQSNFNFSCNFEFNLIGTSIEISDEFIYMADFIENLNIYTISIDLYEGVKFKCHRNYHLRDPNFINPDERLIKLIKEHIRREIKDYVNANKKGI